MVDADGVSVVVERGERAVRSEGARARASRPKPLPGSCRTRDAPAAPSGSHLDLERHVRLVDLRRVGLRRERAVPVFASAKRRRGGTGRARRARRRGRRRPRAARHPRRARERHGPRSCSSRWPSWSRPRSESALPVTIVLPVKSTGSFGFGLRGEHLAGLRRRGRRRRRRLVRRRARRRGRLGLVLGLGLGGRRGRRRRLVPHDVHLGRRLGHLCCTRCSQATTLTSAIKADHQQRAAGSEPEPRRQARDLRVQPEHRAHRIVVEGRNAVGPATAQAGARLPCHSSTRELPSGRPSSTRLGSTVSAVRSRPASRRTRSWSRAPASAGRARGSPGRG